MGVDLAKARQQLEESRKRQEERKNFGKFLTLKEGPNLLRLLPPWNDKGEWSVEAAYHFGVVPKRALLCPRVTYKEECPICDFVNELYKTKGKEDKEQANALKAKVRVLANVLDLDKKDGKVYLFSFGPTIRDAFLTFFADSEYGDFTDIEKGANVKLTKTGEKINTEYDVKVSRQNSPIENWAKVKTELFDLTAHVAGDKVPFETLKGLLEGDAKTIEEFTKEKTTTTTPESDTTSKPVDEFETPKTDAKKETAKAVEPTKEAPKAENKDADRRSALQATLERLKGNKK